MSWLEKATSWEGIDGNALIHLALVCVVVYFFTFYLVDRVRFLAAHKDDCLVPCGPGWYASCKAILPNLRDDFYHLITVNKPADIHQCLFTWWELSHMFFHMYFGLYYNLQLSMGLGLLFE